MKFYKPHRSTLPTALWNPATDAPRFVFVDGVFETEDEEVIKIMGEMSYPTDAPPSMNQQVEMPQSKSRTAKAQEKR